MLSYRRPESWRFIVLASPAVLGQPCFPCRFIALRYAIALLIIELAHDPSLERRKNGIGVASCRRGAVRPLPDVALTTSDRPLQRADAGVYPALHHSRGRGG